MPTHLREILQKKLIPVTFERKMGLFGATSIGTGALMGAGVYVLIGLAAGVAGPSVWLSYIICGALAFLTTLLYADLARLVPISGGGYANAYESLGSLGGFVTGWFLALGSVFACGLYAIGFAEYFVSILGYTVAPFGVKVIAGVLVLLSTFLNSRGTKGADRIQNLLTWSNLGILILFIVVSFFHLRPELATPTFPLGLEGTFGAIGIIYISFFGYQLIANNADEIKDPTATIPKAMKYSMGIAFLFFLMVAVVSIMVVPWQDLARSNAPLVDVATVSFGSSGWLIISLGGVLAAAAALNSTLLSQGRQIYAMGKDRFIPDLLGKIHEGARTPRAAILAGGVLVLLFLLIFQLQFITKAANFCLLVSLLPVSMALRKIYRQNPGKQPKSIWRKYLPEVTLLTNTLLLATLDWLSILFGLQLALVGGLIYLFYSRKRVARTESGLHFILKEDKPAFRSFTTERILMPIANPNNQLSIFELCTALLSKRGGEIVALRVVLSPEQMDFRSALFDSDESLELLERIGHWELPENIKIHPVIRASHSLEPGIVHAAEEEGCSLTVMGYTNQETSSKRSELLENILNQASTDFIFLKTYENKEHFRPQKIAVSLGGRLNLGLMVRLAGALAAQSKGEITFLNILPADFTAEQQSRTGKIFIEAIQKHSSRALYSIQVLASDDPIDTLVERSEQFDLLIVGATKVGFLKRLMLGNFATQITERARCSVAIVRVMPTGHKILKGI